MGAEASPTTCDHSLYFREDFLPLSLSPDRLFLCFQCSVELSEHFLLWKGMAFETQNSSAEQQELSHSGQ